MVVHSEKRLLWHPQGKNRFLVGGGSQITLYEWMPESSEIKQITAKLDLSLMKCFTWSPDPFFDDLVAIGMSTGKVDLIRVTATKFSRNHVLSSGPSVSLPLRVSRACNALAFSDADPNYLAVGLDKVRGDPSLVIWDIHSATPSLSLSPSAPSDSANQVSFSVRPNSDLHIPRGNLPPRTDQRMLQQHAPAEIVSSVSFLPSSPSHLLAGISNRWLRLIDLRVPLSNAFDVAAKVHGIATDPFEPHRIGTFGEGAATIWDARRLGQPLLTFTEKDAGADGARVRPGAAFTSIEFSSTRRGLLATLERDAHHVRFWDLQQAEIIHASSPERTRSRDSSQSGKVMRSWTNPSSMLTSWTGSSGASSSQSPAGVPGDSGVPYNVMLSDTRKTKNFAHPLASFALVPNANAHPLTSNVMVVNKEGDLELYAMHDTPKSTPWSARGDLAIALGCSYRIFPGIHDQGPPPEPWDIPILPSLPGSKSHSLDRHLTREDSVVRGRSGNVHRSPAPMFGRGDEDGFPALPAKPQTNLAATRPGRSRTYSPAALRNLPSERALVTNEEPSRAPSALPVVNGTGTPTLNGGHQRGKHAHVQHARDASITRISSTEKTTQHLVDEDISMLMRHRVVKGYGLANPMHNAVILSEVVPAEFALVELWRWIAHSQRLVSGPLSRLEGYNFSYQGLLGIWEGFRSSQPPAGSTHTTPRVVKRNILPNTPVVTLSALPMDSHLGQASRQSSRRRAHLANTGVSEDFLVAVNVLNERSRVEPSAWKPSVSTAKLAQRQLALELCEWSLAEDDLARALKRWEKEHKYSRAACWLVFTDQSRRAADLLMRSNDESLHIMSGMLAALAPSTSGSSPKNHELMQHCERLIIRMQDPYLRAMLTYLTLGDWSEVLQEDALPLRERLAIAFQFLEDKEITSFLRRVTDRCCHEGDIEGLIVTGLTPAGMDILQSYVDTTGDVQTAAVLSSLSPSLAHDVRSERWSDAYRNILDGWKLFHHRCQFDIDRGKLLHDAIQNLEIPPFEWAPRQILIHCHYCNKPMDLPYSETRTPRATACPHCNRPLPRCAICLMTLSIVQDSVRNTALASSDGRDTIDDALVFCQTCRHGGHASHILQWFYEEDGRRSHRTCPVAGCECRCADEF